MGHLPLIISIMRSLLLLALLPLAFAGPIISQDRWGFGLIEALLAGSSSTTTTAAAETTTTRTSTAAAAGETTTKSGIFGLGLLPNNGGLLGFGLLGGNSDETTTVAATTTITVQDVKKRSICLLQPRICTSPKI